MNISLRSIVSTCLYKRSTMLFGSGRWYRPVKEEAFRVSGSDPDARDKERVWFAQICAKNAQRAGLLFLGTDVLFHGFGGDGSGGFEGVSGLDAGGGGGDSSPSLARRDTEGEGDQEKRHDD